MTMRHGRIPWPRPEELDPDQRAVYDAIVGGPRGSASAFSLTDGEGRLEGPFNSMLLVPALGDTLQALGAAIRYRSPLTDREREIAILVLAACRRSEFEWYAHERVGLRAGLTAQEIEALGSEAPTPTLDGSEQAVRDLTHRLVTARDLDDEEYARGVTVLGTGKLAALVTLVGYYDHLALALTVHRAPLPPDASPRFT